MRALEFGQRPNYAHPCFESQLAFEAAARRAVFLHLRSEAAVIIPPRSTSVSSETAATQRDKHLRTIAKHGSLGWQQSSGYSRRSLVETAMYGYKTIIGRRLRAWTLPNQKTEAKIGYNVPNRMTSLGMPVSVRVK